jgi:hypothetical protein
MQRELVSGSVLWLEEIRGASTWLTCCLLAKLAWRMSLAEF